MIQGSYSISLPQLVSLRHSWSVLFGLLSELCSRYTVQYCIRLFHYSTRIYYTEETISSLELGATAGFRPSSIVLDIRRSGYEQPERFATEEFIQVAAVWCRILADSSPCPWVCFRASNRCAGMLACVAPVLLALISSVNVRAQSCGEAWQRPCDDGVCKSGSVFYRPGAKDHPAPS